MLALKSSIWKFLLAVETIQPMRKWFLELMVATKQSLSPRLSGITELVDHQVHKTVQKITTRFHEGVSELYKVHSETISENAVTHVI